MKPELEERALSIVLQLAESPAAERDGLRNQLCGEDAELSSAVADLWQAHEDAERKEFWQLPAHAMLGSSESPAVVQDLNDSTDPNSRTRAESQSLAENLRQPASEGLRPTAGRFQPLELLGQGGQGEVWRALDPELDRHVALKVLKPGLRGSKGTIDKFQREAEVTGQLEHPNIVPIYEARERAADGSPYYVMRILQEKSLQAAIDSFHQGLISSATHRDYENNLRALLNRFLDVCDAIAYAHSRNVIHRDLKPANVMLGDFGETMVVDWGLAKVLDARDVASDISVGVMSSQTETAAGVALGTPAYMPPEQARGDQQQIGRTADIYTLGGILYAILTGRAPHVAPAELRKPRAEEHPIQPLIEHIGSGQLLITPPQQVSPRVPKALSAICLKALSSNPADRYQQAASPEANAQTLANDIRRWMNDEAVGVYRDPWFKRQQRRTRQNPRAAASIAATVLVATIAFAISSVVLKRERDRLELALQVGFKLLRGIEREAKWSIDDAYSDILQNGLRLPDDERAAMLPLYLALIDLQSADELNRNSQRGDTPSALVLIDQVQARIKLGNALTNLDTSIKLHEESGLAWLLKAQIRRENLHEPPADVLPDWNRAVALLPQSSAVLSGRGWCWLALQKSDQAQSDLNHSAQLDDRNEFAQLGLGRLAEAEGDLDRAVRHFRAAAELPMRYNQDRMWRLSAHVEASYALWARGRQRLQEDGPKAAFDDMFLAVQFAQPKDCPKLWENLLVLALELPVESALRTRNDVRSASSRFRNRPTFDYSRDVLVAVLDARTNQPDLKLWSQLRERRAGEPSLAGELTADFESNLRQWITAEEVPQAIRQGVSEFLNLRAAD